MADEAAPEGESAPVAEEAAPAGMPPSMFTVSVVSAKGLPEGTATAVSYKYSMLTEEQCGLMVSHRQGSALQMEREEDSRSRTGSRGARAAGDSHHGKVLFQLYS